MLKGAARADDARALIAGRLRARRDELVRAIFAEVWGNASDRVGEHDAWYIAQLHGAVAAALECLLREIERGEECEAPISSPPPAPLARAGSSVWSGDGGSALPALLGSRRARRPRECLLFLAGHPGSSNRELALGIGVVHQPQISRLLSLLVAEGLVYRYSRGRGMRNAWWLTSYGRDVVEKLPRDM